MWSWTNCTVAESGRWLRTGPLFFQVKVGRLANILDLTLNVWVTVKHHPKISTSLLRLNLSLTDLQFKLIWYPIISIWWSCQKFSFAIIYFQLILDHPGSNVTCAGIYMDQIILRIFKMLCSYYVTSKKFKLYGIKCYYKDVRHARNKKKTKKIPKLKFWYFIKKVKINKTSFVCIFSKIKLKI